MTKSTSRWPKQDLASMNAFYGDPDANKDGHPDVKWVAENTTMLLPPYRMQWSWGGHVQSIRIHKKCAASLNRILENIRDHYGSQEAIEKAEMHLCGGAYNFRMMRGSTTRRSIHSWAAAIDIDPVRNPMGLRWQDNDAQMPIKVVEIFEAEGWTWGGLWKVPDGQHFQAADV